MEEREYSLEVGRRIRDARRSAGLTQEDLGDEVNLSRTSITNIENGNQPVTVGLLYLVAAAVACDPVELLPSAAETRRSALPTDVPPKTAAVIRRLAAAAR